MKATPNRHRKVLILADGLLIGGAERQLALLAKYLPPHWERRVWSMTDGPFKEMMVNANVRVDVRKRSWRFDVAPALGLWQTIMDWSPDIVHAWGWMSCLAAIPICRVLRIPLIDGTIRQGFKPPDGRWHQFLRRSFADGFIANSRAGLNAWGVSEAKGKVIYNGFDPARLELIDENAENEKFTVVMAGRMMKQKDFNNFLMTARSISKKDKKWLFLAIGAGPDRPKLMKCADDLIDMDFVRFPEAQTEVLPYIKTAHVGVLLSTPLIQAEGCSNAIMEYMACKLPVICTSGGGNQEIVIDGQTGFLIPPGNPEALADRLRFLYENRELARKMGCAGHERFLEMFSVETMVKETVEYYNQFIKE